jgi:hypothetical protein
MLGLAQYAAAPAALCWTGHNRLGAVMLEFTLKSPTRFLNDIVTAAAPGRQDRAAADRRAAAPGQQAPTRRRRRRHDGVGSAPSGPNAPHPPLAW